MNYLYELAGFSNSLSISELPNEVRERAKLLILDSLTAIAVGNQHSNVLKFMKSVTNSQTTANNEQGLILGTDLRSDYRTAALVNGIGMVSDELDEGNPIAKGHPACHFVPALVSLAVQKKKTGSDFLAAFVVNYEIGARMGASVQLKSSVHPHGNWGVFANGFGVGKLLGWKSNKDTIQAAMLGASFSLPTLWESVLEGHQVRNATIGLNNFHTTLLTDFVGAGFSASMSTPEHIFNGILADRFESAYMTKVLGVEFYLLNSYFKFYPYCRFCHSPIDAVKRLVKGVDIDDLKEIQVHTYSLAAKLKNQQVNNEFAGKFSIPFAVASELANEKYPQLIDSKREQVVQEIMNKVVVLEKQAYTDLLPHKRVTSVEIEWNSGEKKEVTVERATGDSDEVKLTEKVIQKCKERLIPIVGERKVEEIIDSVFKLEEIEEMSSIIKQFTKNA